MNPRELIAEVLEHARGMWRYRWWAASAAWGLSVVGSFYVYSIPDIYRAQAKVFVDTSSLLRPLMQGLAVASDTMNEVQLVSRAVLTRPNLEKVAYETDLALRARTPEQLEAMVTSLLEQIHVSGGRDNVFTIEYEDINRDKAREVVAAVLDTFVEGAISNQGDDAEITERALANEIQVHENRLRDAEETLAKFKQTNLGYMPGENTDYYKRLQTALANVEQTKEKLSQVEQRRDELRRQSEGEEPVFGVVPTNSTASRCSRGAQIGELRRQLDALSVNFTDKHPRIVTLKENIAQLEQECQGEIATSAAASPGLSPDQRLEVNPVYQNLRIQLSSAEVEIVELRARLNGEQGEVDKLRRDVDKITTVETELKQLNRDYDVIQSRHRELIKRWEDLQAKKRLDPVTDNVQYRPIEPPFAQAEPVGPNRTLFLAAVLIASLGGATALAFALNQVNPVFFTRIGLAKATRLPVLGAVSMIMTPQQALRRRLAMQGWAAVIVLLLMSTVASVVMSRQGATFVQGLFAG